MKFWFCFLLWEIIIFIHFQFGQSAQFLTVNHDGGYENIVVAISPHISEVEGKLLIPKIEEMIQLTSKRLHTASRKTFYFKKVFILVPENWNSTIEMATFQVHKEAEIRIDEGSIGTMGKRICTQQPRGCGEPADFIQITTRFFQNRMTPNKILVNQMIQEWSRLRFGIFEEHGHKNSKTFPDTYLTGRNTHKTTCNEPNPWICSSPSSANNVMDEEKCRLIKSIPALTSSIMSNTSIPTAFFCEHKNHNVMAPTRHNALCKEKSTWRVITETKDYKAVKKSNTLPPPVEIITVRSVSNSNIVLIIDPELCSTSAGTMHNATKDSVFKLLLKDFSDDNLPGLIIANGDLVNGLGSNHSTRVDLLNAFDKACSLEETKDLAKNIPKALDDATQMIKNNTLTDESLGVIILIANGLTLNDSDIPNIPTSTSKNIRFHLITYPTTTRAFREIEGMNWYPVFYQDRFSCDLEARVEFDEIFQFILDQYDSHFVPRRNMVFRRLFKFSFDSKIKNLPGGKYTFVLHYCQKQDMIIPELKVNRKIVATHTLDYLPTVSFSEAIVNPRMYEINVKEGEPCFVSILFEPDIPQIYNVMGEIDKHMPLGYVTLRVFAPWENATISAHVTKDTGKSQKILLSSTGSKKSDPNTGIIWFEDDFIPPRENPGFYSIVFEVSVEDDFQFDQTPKLRTYSSFYVKEMPAIPSPPRRIVDFTLENIDQIHRTVSFSWTAPNDLTSKIFLTLFVCDIGQVFLDNLSQYRTIDIPAHVSGTKQRYNWIPPPPSQFDELYFCAIRAINKNGLVSDRSNVVLVEIPRRSKPSFTSIAPVTLRTRTSIKSSKTTNTEQPRLTSEEKTNSMDDFMNGAVGGVVAGSLMSIICVIVIVIAVYQSKKRKIAKNLVSSNPNTRSAATVNENRSMSSASPEQIFQRQNDPPPYHIRIPQNVV